MGRIEGSRTESTCNSEPQSLYCDYLDDGDLVIGQWWQFQMCAKCGGCGEVEVIVYRRIWSRYFSNWLGQNRDMQTCCGQEKMSMGNGGRCRCAPSAMILVRRWSTRQTSSHCLWVINFQTYICDLPSHRDQPNAWTNPVSIDGR